MHSNLIWRAFLCVLFMITLWYSGVAVYRYYSYIRLDEQTFASSVEWRVKELAGDEYILAAAYSYQVDHEPYSGHYDWVDDIYRNEYAAEQQLQEFSSQKWRVWVDSNSPSYSSLQKNIPFKECISAMVLWGILLYFLWLGYYIAKFKT